ncbi:MAG: TlpA family protein disulfide reductase [Candidatus Marinimicrobia bacterium]|nr:TlpA family protein disulfide reductase [Candidatus Neomarinimicrobiota bacterium]
MRRYFITGIMLFAVIVGCAQKDNSPPRTNASVRPANAIKAPDFSLMTVDGKQFTLTDYAGKVILLNFWGTWCPPCRREIPDFIKLYDKYQKDGLEIVGITLSSGTAADIAKFSQQWNMNYHILTDINGSESQEVTALYSRATNYPINGIPTTFLIDRDGYIRKSYVGPRTEEIFYNDLKPFL